MPSPFDAVLEAPFGKLGVRVADGALRELVLPAGRHAPRQFIGRVDRKAGPSARCVLQRPSRDIRRPLARAGTDFQHRVWQAISAIPCGSVITYGTIAQQIGSVPRAVGQACGDNWFPILIPCHRVVSASGIGGFSHHTDGYLLNIKHWLLRHEGVMLI